MALLISALTEDYQLKTDDPCAIVAAAAANSASQLAAMRSLSAAARKRIGIKAKV